MFFPAATLLAVIALANGSPAPPRPAGHLYRRDAVYPVNNPTNDCYPYEVMNTRGVSNAYYQPADTYPTMQGIIGGRPGGNYWENPKINSYDIGNYISKKNTLCPNTKFVLTAFSAGTSFLTQTMNNATLDKSNVVAIITYGNGLWKAGRIENRGSATTGHGAFTGSGLAIPPQYEPITRDYCNVGDWECQNLTPDYGPTGPHHSYVNSTLQDDAVSFAIAQLDLAITPTASQAVTNTKRRAQAQQFIGDTTMCDLGHSYCPTRDSDEWKCIATHSTLEYCGGCPGGPVELGYGQDCTSIVGADEVSCVQGVCQVVSWLEDDE